MDYCQYNKVKIHCEYAMHRQDRRISRFYARMRNFTDSVIIGSKAFAAENYRRFRHLISLHIIAFISTMASGQRVMIIEKLGTL